MYGRLLAIGLVLFVLSGYVREITGLDDHLQQAMEFARATWETGLGFLDRVPWMVTLLVAGFDVALVWLLLRAVATFHLGLPSYLDALVLFRVNLTQGVVWTSRMQLRVLLALPVAITATILWRGHWSLLALGFALFSVWYLGAAINPRSINKMMAMLNRASLAIRDDSDAADDNWQDDGRD